MKRLLPCLLTILLLLLSSCGGKAVNTVLPAAPVSPASKGDISLDRLDIDGIMFTDLNSGQKVEYTITELINEFRSFISGQVYNVTDVEWDKSYKALLLDNDNHTMLEMTFGSRSAAFDRDVEIGGRHYEKDKTYETGGWINEYMMQFIQGAVLNPAHISYPAKLRIPGGYYTTEMLNDGSLIINQYETLPALHAFTDGSLIGKDIEITGSERLFSIESMQAEEAKQDGTRVIRIYCESSDPYMHINSQNEYDELTGSSLTLYRDAEGAGTYRLYTGGEVFAIKVDTTFDKAFQKLFDDDLKTTQRLKVSDVEKLIAKKEPWSMDYICRNLGMGLWNKREDDILKRDSVKLGNGKPYTVLALKNPYDLRLMFFNIKTGIFIDYIDFGHRQAGTEYDVERAGRYAWIVGDRNRGHGTGEDINNREWYTVDDSGKKLALSIPYNTYSVSPFGGSMFKAEGIRLEKGNPVRLEVDYSLTRVYMLDVPEADEYGQVNIIGKKTVEFVWDDGQQKFTSDYPADEQGATQISPECTGITKKVGVILERDYDELLDEIKALDSIENKLEEDHKTGALEQFLEDCPDSYKKAALIGLLSEKTLTIQK